MRLKLTSMHHATAPTNASSSGYYNDNDNTAEQYTLTMLAAHTNTWQGDNQLFSIFYRAVLAMGLCLSQVRVLLKRQNVGSHKQHHTIPQGL